MNKKLRSVGLMMAGAVSVVMSLGAEAAGGPAAERDIAALAKKIYPSVVRVEARNGTRRVATGVVIDRDGLIMTTPSLADPEIVDRMQTSRLDALARIGRCFGDGA